MGQTSSTRYHQKLNRLDSLHWCVVMLKGDRPFAKTHSQLIQVTRSFQNFILILTTELNLEEAQGMR
jgi:hypothetical protein